MRVQLLRSCQPVVRRNLFPGWLLVGLLLLAATLPVSAQRQMEPLGRGLIALRNTTSQVYVGWRLLGNDPSDIAFNLYRSGNGAPAVKINVVPLSFTTDYVDSPPNLSTTTYTYSVKPVRNGVEVPDTWANPLAPPATLPANAPVQPSLYVRVPLQPTPDGAHGVKFCWVGDLDGDGEYDFVVDRQPPAPARQFLEAYKRDGTFLWRMDLGPNSANHYNIEPGSSTISIGHGDNVTVYDMDGDGKAEVLLRTANGVVFGNGVTLTHADNRVQFMSVVNGLTGAELARATIPNPYLADGQMNGHMGILYCDGVRPSVFWHSTNRRNDPGDDLGFNGLATTWDYRNGNITQRWSRLFSTLTHEAAGHQIRFGDPDNDGKDEYLDVGHGLDDDGTQLYANPAIAHGDRYHIGDIDPDRPGLETYIIQQNNAAGLATALYESATGKIIKGWYAGGAVDVGRGTATDFDPTRKGFELASTQPGIFDCKGIQIYANSFFPVEAIWWDADLSREFLQPNETVRISKVNSGVLSYFDLIDKNTDAPGAYLAYGGRPAFWGDLFGDWREELVVVENNNAALRIYTTDYAASSRLYTLMHNPQYRIQTTTKGYVQASIVDYYLGTGMTIPPPPPMVDAQLVWRGSAGNVWDETVTANWFTNKLWVSNTVPVTFASGASVLFDLTGSNNTAIALAGTLTPGDVTVYAPKDFSLGGSGSLSGAMKLTKAGKGTLTLTGTNDFSGATTVWDGVLLVNGDLQNSPVTVWGGTWGGPLALGLTGGRIGGTGRFSQPVSLRYRATVTPGLGMTNAGTITFGSGLTAEDGTTFAFDLSDDAIGLTKTNDLIVVSGNLTLSGTNTFVIRKLDATLPPGIYPLIQYSGSFSGNLNNLVIAGLDGVPVALTNASGQLALLVKSTRPPTTLTWTGGLNGNAWDLVTTSNWLNGASKDTFVPQDTVRFDAIGSSNLTANLVGSLAAASVVVDSTANYTFAGSGILIGAGGLVKSNTGTLTLNTLNNTYTGPTIIAGGTVVVPELDAVGFPSPFGNPGSSPANLTLSGSATLRVAGESYTDRGLTLNAGTNTIEVSSGSAQVTVAGQIVGNGLLRKAGSGLLALSAQNTFSGGAIIQGGGVALIGANGNRFGLGSGLITFLTGTVSFMDLQSSLTYPHNFSVPGGSSGRIDCDGRSFMTGTLTGSGTFTVMTPFVRTDFNGNWSAFTGQLNVISDGDGGSFRWNNSAGLPNARVNVGNLVSLQNRMGGTPTISLGELSGATGGNLSGGTGSDGLAVNWSVGGLNTSATFAGSTYNSVGLIKVGTGAWTLSGTNLTHTGQTTVNGGTLLYNGNGSNSTSVVTVGAAGTLGGTGVIGGNTTINGKLAPGTTAIGTLTFRGNLTFGAGGIAVMEIQKSNGTKDLATAIGTITYGGTLVVSNLAGTLASGDSFKIFNAGIYAGNFATFNLPPLTPGLSWNTSALNISGTLSVTTSGIVPPPAAPGGLVATPTSHSQINLSWTDNSTNELNFLIERSLDNSAFTQIGSVGAGVTTYPSTGLSAATLYYYRVRASNNGGVSDYSNVASATTSNAPPAPPEVVKANNLTNLDQASAWTNGVAPTAASVALWDATVTAANTTSLGADASWAGIRIANPAGLVTINAGNTLTLGEAGVDLSAAAQSLTLNNAVTLGAAQTWNVATARFLTVGGAFVSGSGNLLTKTGPGQVLLTPFIAAVGAPEGIAVNQGTLRLTGAGSTLPLKLNGGTLDMGAALSTPVDIGTNGGTILVTANRTLSANIIGSNATLNLSLTGGQMSFGADVFAEFHGTVLLGGSPNGMRANTATFSGSDHVTFDLGTSTSYLNRQNSAATIALGALTGGPATSLGVNAGSVTWAIGGKNLDSTFTGTISGAAALVKTGSGQLTLSGANSYSGLTTISNGVLQIGDGGITGIGGTNDIVNHATLAFNRSDMINYDGAISGPGSLAQIGEGTLALSGVHTYSGATTIEAGTLALTGAAGIANSPRINIAVGAVLDVSSHNGASLTLATGQMLSGNGAVNGNLTLASGAKLSPGNSIGTLAFNDSLTLSAGSSSTLEISSGPVAFDQVRVLGNLHCGGSLLVTNAGVNPLAAGDSFQLFDAAAQSGTFSSVILPALGPQLAWDTSLLYVTGTIAVVSTAPPEFGTIQPLNDGNFQLTFTGPTGANYELRATTNLTVTPITLWDLLDTGTFGVGPMTFDDLSATNHPQRFYQLRLP